VGDPHQRGRGGGNSSAAMPPALATRPPHRSPGGDAGACAGGYLWWRIWSMALVCRWRGGGGVYVCGGMMGAPRQWRGNRPFSQCRRTVLRGREVGRRQGALIG